ncbi:FAD-dependent monooxygenase, partial [Streptomyces albidoflavus]
MTTFDTDVVVIGAGPVGLTLANLIGVRGHRATVLEARHELIDYPRGVGLDDESIRTLRTAGLWERVRPCHLAHHVGRVVKGPAKVICTNNTPPAAFGLPRNHSEVPPQ